MAAVVLGVATPLTTNVTAYASGAFTPAAGDLLVVIAAGSGTTGNTPSCAGSTGLTFTRILAPAENSGDITAVFVADATATAVSQTVTVTWGTAGTGTALTVLRVSGMSRTGTSAVRQTKSVTGTSTVVAPPITLDTAPLTTNPIILSMSNNTNPATMTPPTSWTERSDQGYASPTSGQATASIDSGYTNALITWGSVSPSVHLTIAVELDASAVATDAPYPYVGGGYYG